MNLEKRIEKDLQDLCSCGKISEAVNLDGLVASAQNGHSFSIQGFPGYYVGNREAKTVMVMLNPGNDVDKSDKEVYADLLKCNMHYTLKGLLKQQPCCSNCSQTAQYCFNVDVKKYHDWCKNYGKHDRLRHDNFDLKQAFFLRDWKNTGINLPSGLNANIDMSTKLEAKEKVLTEKLQLELVPYASRAFGNLNKKMLKNLMPFVDTLLEEIFAHKRTYVIFCSRKFEEVFKEYNKSNPGTFDFVKTNAVVNVIPNSNIKGSCSVIRINYKGEVQKALIANTFPNQALPNAYDTMAAYGKFCYDEWISVP